MSTPNTMSDTSDSFTNIPQEHAPNPQLNNQEERLAVLWQQVADLTERSNRLQENLLVANERAIRAEERAIHAETQAAIAKDNASVRVTNPTNKVKVREPDDFDGSRDKVDFFMRQLKGYLAQDPNLNAKAQLNVALGYCVGKIAGTWADRQADLITEDKEGKLTSVEDFEKRLRETFGDPEKGSTARHKLSLSRQQGTPIDQFIIKFEMLEADAGLDEVALTEAWKKAMDKHVWDKCYEALEIPKTLKEWKERCLIYDRNFRRRDEEAKARTNYPNKRFPTKLP